VTQVGLPPLPPAPKYSMLVISAYSTSGLTSRVHLHSGEEAFYVVDGEQCLETPTHAYKMPKDGTLAVPAGVTMRLVATGSRDQSLAGRLRASFTTRRSHQRREWRLGRSSYRASSLIWRRLTTKE
jgi:hypothetical protein